MYLQIKSFKLKGKIGLLLILTSFIFYSCHVGVYEVFKNDHIDTGLKHQIHSLNDQLFKAVMTNNPAAVKQLMSAKANENSGANLEKLTAMVSGSLKAESYSVLDEYEISNSTSGIEYTIPAGKSTREDYFLHYRAGTHHTYITLLATQHLHNDFLITLIYGEYGNTWKIDNLRVGNYKILGKTPFALFDLAKENYEKAYLVNAINFISLSNVCIRPAGDLLQYQKENEIKSFYEKIIKEAKDKYPLPFTLTHIESKPKIFNIHPEMEIGLFPVIQYMTAIDLKDTTRLKTEYDEIKKEIRNVFLGIGKDKGYIYFQAANELPDGRKIFPFHNFIDTL